MNKVTRLIALGLLMVISFQGSSANTPKNFKVYSIGGKKINVQAMNIAGRGKLIIKNENEVVVFQKTQRIDSELAITVDASSLQEGLYTLMIQDDNKTQSVPLDITKTEVKVNMKEVSRTFHPQILNMNHEVIVKMISDDSNDLRINIRNSNGQSLFKEELKGRNGLIGKRFEFLPGEYEITLASEHFRKTQLLVIR